MVVEECNGSSEGIRIMQKKDYTMIKLHTLCTTKVLISLSCVQSIQRFLYVSGDICIFSLSYYFIFRCLVLSYLVKQPKMKLFIIEVHAYIEAMFC